MIETLLKSGPIVVNFGMESFYDDLKVQDVPVVHVDWRPPLAGGDLLSKLKKLKTR
jgi:FdrA protein